MVNPLIWLNELKYEYSLLRVLRGQLSTFNDFPTLIELQLTNRCNAHCIMCTYPQTIQKQPYTVLADETYEDLLRQFSAEPSLKVIVLGFQSEPFLDKILIERCRRLKEVLPHVHLEVMTNGSMLMNTDLDELFASVDMLHVSINAFSPETYAQIMQGLEFNKVLEGVHRIQQNKAWRNKTYLRLIKQQANIHERRLFKKYWNNKGFRVFGYDINSRLGTLDNFDNLQVKQSAPKKLQLAFFRFVSRWALPVCTVPLASAYIRANGDAVLCFNDWSENHIMGNIHTQTVRQFYNSPEYQHIRESRFSRKPDDNPVCNACELYSEGVWLTV